MKPKYNKNNKLFVRITLGDDSIYEFEAFPEDIVAFGGNLYSKPKLIKRAEGSIYDVAIEFDELCCDGELTEVINAMWDEQEASTTVTRIEKDDYLVFIGKVKSIIEKEPEQ